MILGIDPSLNATGWAILNTQRDATIIACGVIKPPHANANYIEKIANISSKISEIIKEYGIKNAAMEETMSNKNAYSSLKLAMVRGACISICCEHKTEITEYLPKYIKLAVTGSGGATKEQVEFIIRQSITVADNVNFKTNDMSDAAATALTHHYVSTSPLLQAKINSEKK